MRSIISKSAESSDFTHNYIKLYNTTFLQAGNKCGHNPQTPDFSIRTKPNFDFISLAIARLQEYYPRPSLIPSLKYASSTKQQRTELREAVIRLLSVMFSFTDFTSMRVGIPTEKGFMNFTTKYLAKQANITLKRAERALKVCKKAGLINVYPINQKQKNGKWKGHAASKVINTHLFGILGLSIKLNKERGRSSRRLKKLAQNKKMSLGDFSRVSLLFGMKKKKRSTVTQQKSKHNQIIQNTKNKSIMILDKMLDLQDKYPDKTISELRFMAEKESL